MAPAGPPTFRAIARRAFERALVADLMAGTDSQTQRETAPLRQHAKHVCGGAGASCVTTPSGCFLDGLGFSWQLRLAPGDRASRQEPPTGGASAVAPGDPREAGEPGDIGVPPHTGARGAGDSARAPHRSRRPYGRYTFSVGAAERRGRAGRGFSPGDEPNKRNAPQRGAVNFKMLTPTAPAPGRTISLHAPATGAKAPASITWPLRGRRLTSWPARTAKRNETAPLRQHAKHVCGGAGVTYLTTRPGSFPQTYKGRHIPAQGAALGTRVRPQTGEPCKGETYPGQPSIARYLPRYLRT